MRVAPEVLNGMRVRNQTSRPAEINAGLFARITAFMADRGAPKVKRPPTPYEVVFESRYSRHRIQIDSPEAQIDARGRKIHKRPLVAQFDHGMFSIPKRLPLAEAEYMLGILRDHPAVKSKEVWEQTDLNQAVQVKKIATIVDSMKKDPELHKSVLEFLETEDYTDETEVPAVEEEIEAAAEELEPAPAKLISKVSTKGAQRRGRLRKLKS